MEVSEILTERMSDADAPSTQAYGRHGLSKSVPVLGENFLDIDDFQCAFCKKIIYSRRSGRFICPRCGLTVGEWVDPEPQREARAKKNDAWYLKRWYRESVAWRIDE
jgi:hypothetical protein